MTQTYGHPLEDWKQAREEIRCVLIRCVRDDRTITYAELASQICTIRLTPRSRALGEILNQISSAEHAAGRGILSAMVVAKSSGMPGQGFFDLALRLGKQSTNKREFWNKERTCVVDSWRGDPELSERRSMKKILITGMSGLIGGILRSHLETLGGYELTALNRRPVDGVRTVQADIGDLDAIRPAFEGQDVVVHLAAHVASEPMEDVVRGNLAGTWNVYEAAREAGVQRVIFASSGDTIRGIDHDPPYSQIVAGDYESVSRWEWPKVTKELVRPRTFYGASKVWGEVLGRVYSADYGLSVLCVRIGSCPAENRPTNVREFSAWLSHRDVADILHRCIEAPADLLYDIFFAVSNNKWNYRDIEHARRVLGYVPQDSAEDYRE
jgi:dTDP-4-dehydrorhamnose reductase